MRKLNDRDENSMSLWLEILKARVETGEPYIMFKDNVNKDNPLAYAMNNLGCFNDQYMYRNNTTYR
jgi:ribonucleotide reductase alpha subunit